MKNNIAKTALVFAICVLTFLGAKSETNKLGKVKNTDYVVIKEDDPQFQSWRGEQDFRWPKYGTAGQFKVYPENGIKGFFIGDVSLYDILRGGTNGLLSVEVDPLFTEWLGNNTYVKVEKDPTVPAWAKVEVPPYLTSETDPLFYGWLGGTTIEFTNATPKTVKIGNTTVESLLDGKLDATNGVAFGVLYVLPEEVPGGHVGDGHALLDNESLRFTNTTSGPDITYGLNGISALYPGGNEQWYKFDNSENGIARLKDIKDETDPIFWALFGNPILNLLAYDEINLAGTNVVTVTAPMFKVSNSIVVGKDNTVVVSNANIIGNSNRAGVKGWYYTGIQFTTNAAGVAQINQPATIYLTDDIAKRNTGTLEKDSSFVSGFKVGDPVCIVNNSKYDMECNVTAVDGNAITVDKIPFSEIATPPDLEYDDYTIISLGDSTLGCVEFSDSSFVAGIGNSVYRRAGAAFGRQNTVFGDYGFAEGRNNKVAYAAHAEGYGSDALAWYSHVEGFRNQALAWYAHAGGDDSKAKGYSSFAHGHQAVASGNGAVAFGGVYQYGSNGFAGGNASGQGSFAAGVKSTASGLVSVSIGSNTLASAKHSVAFGRDTQAKADGSFAMGVPGSNGQATMVDTKGRGAVAFGVGSVANGTGAFVAGGLSFATNEFATAFGYSSVAKGDRSFAGGHEAKANATGTFAYGRESSANGIYSVVFGRNSEANGAFSFAGGSNGVASAKFSFAYGNGTRASGEGAVAMGTKSAAGINTEATKKGATAFGTGTKALGDGSFSAGGVTQATNIYSVAFGYSTKAYGNSSFAINSSTEASGAYSFAQGNGTKATNDYAAAFGLTTKAYGSKSMAMGNTTTAAGACSFAGGNQVRVNKNCSIGFGEQIDINGTWDSAFGARLQTTNDCEAAFGKYNKTTKNSTRFSIGIGVTEAGRTNAVEVTTTGKVYVKGVGNYDGTTVSGKQDLASVINTAIQEGSSAAKLLQIKAAAATAQQSLNDANDIDAIKSALNTFFDSIK